MEAERSGVACEHTARKVYSNGLCRSCYEKDLRTTNPEYAERQRTNSRQWSQQHKGHKSDYARTHRRKAKRGSGHKGLSPEEYDEIMSHPCGICGAPSKHLDHDHRCCGQATSCPKCRRGALCHRCNLGLGYYEGWFLENMNAALNWIIESEGN